MQVQTIFLARDAASLRGQPDCVPIGCGSCGAKLSVPFFELMWIHKHNPQVRCIDCLPTDLPLVGVGTVPGASDHLERCCGREARRRMERDLRRWNGAINAGSN